MAVTVAISGRKQQQQKLQYSCTQLLVPISIFSGAQTVCGILSISYVAPREAPAQPQPLRCRGDVASRKIVLGYIPRSCIATPCTRHLVHAGLNYPHNAAVMSERPKRKSDTVHTAIRKVSPSLDSTSCRPSPHSCHTAN
jgi:hypothetical protein